MTNDGGPAFPFPSGPEPREDEFHDRCDGMSLRDWFAGQALIGLVASNVKYDPSGVGGPVYMGEGLLDSGAESLAIDAFAIADQMLAARKEQPR